MSVLPEREPVKNTVKKSSKEEFLTWLKRHEGFTITPYLINRAMQEL